MRAWRSCGHGVTAVGNRSHFGDARSTAARLMNGFGTCHIATANPGVIKPGWRAESRVEPERRPESSPSGAELISSWSSTRVEWSLSRMEVRATENAERPESSLRQAYLLLDE